MTWTANDTTLSAPMRSTVVTRTVAGRKLTIETVTDDTMTSAQGVAFFNDKTPTWSTDFVAADVKEAFDKYIRNRNPEQSNQWGLGQLRDLLTAALAARAEAETEFITNGQPWAIARSKIMAWDSSGIAAYEAAHPKGG